MARKKKKPTSLGDQIKAATQAIVDLNEELDPECPETAYLRAGLHCKLMSLQSMHAVQAGDIGTHLKIEREHQGWAQRLSVAQKLRDSILLPQVIERLDAMDKSADLLIEQDGDLPEFDPNDE